MGNQFKNTWLIILLIVSGGVILILGLGQNKVQNDQGVELKEIFKQEAPKAFASSMPETVTSVATAVADVKTEAVKGADPIPAMGIITSPENGHEVGFAIQVYSFKDKNRAQTALESLKNSGYEAFMIISDLGDKGIWYRVRVGGITDEESAHKMLEEIRKNYNSGVIVKP